MLACSAFASPGVGRTPARLAPPRLSLRINFSWMLLGNVVYAACQWGMLSVLAKLGSPEMVGQFVIGLAVSGPVMVLSLLALRSAQVTDANQEHTFGDYLGLRLATTGLALLVVGVTAVASQTRWDTALVIVATAVATVPESLSDIVYGLLQQRERMDKIANSLIIKGPVSFLAMAGTIACTGSVCAGTLALAVARAAVLVGYDFPAAAWALRSDASDLRLGNWAEIRPRGNVRIWRRLAWLCLPLGVVTMLLSLQGNIPRYFVDHYRGEHELGILAAMVYLTTVGSTIVNALGHSACPRLAQYHAAGDRRNFQALMGKLVAFCVLLGVAGVGVVLVAGRELLSALYTPEYGERTDVLAWVAVGGTLSYVASLLGYGVTAARHFRVQVPLNCLTVLVTAGACWWLVPQWGLLGAAWALAVAGAAQAIGLLAALAVAFPRRSAGRAMEQA